MDDTSEKIPKSAATFLSRWNGAHAELRELAVSSRTPRVLVRGPQEQGNLLISCVDAHIIHSPAGWQNRQFRASKAEHYDGKSDGLGLYDDVAGVELLCGKPEIKNT